MAGARLMGSSRRRYSPSAMGGDASKKMVVGFNHNIKHKGKVYHVQTEDSGVENPHVITHLFVGGNILASKKTSYADILNAENLAEVVRELMEEQHKEMLRNLINGVYDDIDAATARGHYQPGQIQADGRPVKLQPGMSMPRRRPRPARRPAGALPPEVPAAARSSGAQEKPQRGGRGDALRRGPHRGEEPRRGDPLLPRRGPRRPQVSAAGRPTRAGRTEPSPVIQLFHVTKEYPGDGPALQDVTLEIEKGEFVFVTGPSGAGKSTLLKLVFCEEQATSGQLLLFGKNVAKIARARVPYLRRKIGVVFQDFKLLPRRTVAENVALPLEVQGLPDREIRRRVASCSARWGSSTGARSSRPRSRAASSSASRSRARSRRSRRCSSPTSPPATSTRSGRWR